ncbi:conserved hypothetical protein [Luminiphilus syltensis NOR5-1B]|uniref:DUF2254 domain-containing protein n=1 Tax=Luminiphilus syltensis NOR5-1B TaxID=565045 RepID=B8KTV5_9GAMM|nr:conserved hypothetical protein [Luminiphilus syltensis NOR5-1B]
MAAIGLAVTALQVDRHCQACLLILPTLQIELDAARGLLGVLITSVLSVGGVSFSVTMVALTLTSGQYGPKVLRHFLEDSRSKLSLGLFFATAVYALVISVALHDGDHPRFSVIIALLLALAALIEFIAFIHRTASDLQADQLIQRLGTQLRQDMRRLCEVAEQANRLHGSAQWRRRARDRIPIVIRSGYEGYVQTTDIPAIAEQLATLEAMAILRVRPGDFVVRGAELFTLFKARNFDIDEGKLGIEEAIRLGPVRTPIQDPNFPITQIQQIAARALSTGINDPGTAITCIDWLTLALAEIVDAALPGSTVLDKEGKCRLLVTTLDFAAVADAVYSPLRQFSGSNLQVYQRLFDSLNRLAMCTDRPERLLTLRTQGERLWEQMERQDYPEHDRAPVRRRFKKLVRLTQAS